MDTSEGTTPTSTVAPISTPARRSAPSATTTSEAPARSWAPISGSARHPAAARVCRRSRRPMSSTATVTPSTARPLPRQSCLAWPHSCGQRTPRSAGATSSSSWPPPPAVTTPETDGWEQGAVEYGSTTDRYWFNHEYGFGVVDAGAAVDLADGWTNLPSFRSVEGRSVSAQPGDSRCPGTWYPFHDQQQPHAGLTRWVRRVRRS